MRKQRQTSDTFECFDCVRREVILLCQKEKQIEMYNQNVFLLYLNLST